MDSIKKAVGLGPSDPIPEPSSQPNGLLESAKGVAGAAQTKIGEAAEGVKNAYGQCFEKASEKPVEKPIEKPDSQPNELLESARGVAGAAQTKVGEAADGVKNAYGQCVEKAESCLPKHGP